MLELFTPDTKVQKDRKIMRQADERTAKFSRAAAAVHMIVYLLSLLSGDFWVAAPEQAVVMGIILAFSVLWRASYSINFDSIYSAGPKRWRNRYFITSLVNVLVWSVIVVEHIVQLPDHTITGLLLVYTTGISASTIAVYSPYPKYLRWILFLSLVPAAIAYALSGLVAGYAFSLVLLAFFLLLTHQGKLLGEDFWQSREINLELRKRIESLEVEKQGKAAKVEFKNELLSKISYELRLPLNDVSGSLSLLRDTPINDRQEELLVLAENSSSKLLELLDNVLDYSKIVSKELVISQQIYNLRAKLDELAEELSQDANQYNIELLPIYGKNFIDRVKGDSKRLSQLFHVLGNYALHRCNGSELKLNIQMNLLPGSSQYQLSVSFNCAADESNSNMQWSNTVEQESTKTLGMSIAEGLLECMGGQLDIDDYGQHRHWSFHLPLELTSINVPEFQRHPKIHGQAIYLVGYPEAIASYFQEIYEDWRLEVKTCADLKETQFELRNRAATPVTIVSHYLNQQETCEQECYSEILSLQDDLYIQVVMSAEQRGRCSGALSAEKVYSLCKPLNQRKMHNHLVEMLFEPIKQEEEKNIEHDNLSDYRLLLVEDHKVNQMVTKGMLNKLGYSVKVANNGLEALGLIESGEFDLIIMDCQMPEMDGYQATNKVREFEEGKGKDKPTPIIALTAQTDASEETRCLASGMDDFLQKPVRIDDLANCVSHWLKH